MIKKLFSFIFCLAPVGAMAAPTDLVPTDNNGAINITDTTLHLTTGSNSVIIKNSTSYPTATKSLTVDNNGIDVAGGLIVGSYTGSETGWLYLLNETTAGKSEGFTITSAGPIKFGGMLQIENGNYLKIGQTGGNTTSMSLGPTTVDGTPDIALDNSGKLELTNISAFTSTGTIRNNADATSLTVNASSMSTGSIANMGGTMTLGLRDAGGNIIMTGGINTNGGTIISSGAATTTDIIAGNLMSGDIQNGAGTMTIELSGNLNSSGKIENKNGTSMKITAADITVDGTMTNERNDSTMVINATNLNVKGGDSSNASFVNGGNLYITVSGQTSLTNGFDFSTMKKENIFSLTTGTLDTTTSSSDNWLHMFSNKLESFTVNITNGALDLAETDIINGQAFSTETVAGEANSTANMALTANTITAKSVKNSGNDLTMQAAVGAVDITNGITATSGTTNISAATTVTAGAVTNDADMTINGTTGTTVASITNNTTGTLNVFSGTDASGKIIVTNDVNNSGTLEMRARDIKIGNLTNTNGTTTIQGSDHAGDALAMGNVTASGGVININSLLGDIAVNGDLLVQKTETGGGALNIGGSTKSLTTTGAVQIDGDMTLSSTATAAHGAVNIGGTGIQNFVLAAGGNMTFGGNIDATQADAARTANLVAGNISVAGDVNVANAGRLQFGSATTATALNIGGALTSNNPTASADNGARGIEIYSAENIPVYVGSMSGNGLFIVHGNGITAKNGDIDIANNILFDSSSESTGLIVRDVTDFTLSTRDGTNQGNISVGGIKLASGNTLNLTSAKDITVSGLVADNGALNLTAVGNTNIDQDITIETTGALAIDSATIKLADLTNKNIAKLVATDITAGAINAAGGTLDITADSLTATGALDVAGGAIANIAVTDATFTGPVTVTGDMVQGTLPSVGALNITKSGNFEADSLRVTGNFVANDNMNVYNFAKSATITGDITVNNGNVNMTARDGKITANNITNSANLTLASGTGIDVAETIKSTGDMTLNSGTGLITAKNIDWTGTTSLTGAGLNTNGAFAQSMLYQNYTGALFSRDVNVKSDSYAITASYVDVTGIAQTSGQMVLNTNSLDVDRNIDATALRVVGPVDEWLHVGVGGNVSGNTQFINLKHMDIGGNYTFNDNSTLIAAILPYATANGTPENYWATVSTEENNNLGKITKPLDGEPLISVGGKFITDLQTNILNLNGESAQTGQMGIKIFDMIDQGTAIWLLHADQGIEELATKIRNLNVQFCNADGSKCFNYFGSAEAFNGADENLPAYITVRDTENDGTANDVFIVFDPRFGGPMALFKIQPVVGRDPTHTKGEYVSAGALDDLVAGQLQDMKFNNRTPIDAIPVIFAGTNMEEMANQLYARMEYYDQTRDGAALSRFSRLFQAREVEQLSGSLALNEHTSFRDFEDHMFDEFIWNRNRNLRKAWGEFDFGMFSQREADGHHADGNRFSFTGGYDWQEDETLILGLAGRVSHMSGNNKDDIDLGYKPGQPIAGRIDIDVADTNFGVGAYLMQNLGTKMRLYGNGFLDLHWLDISRDQTYMSRIEGDGAAFSLITEWGLLHDWLNQYIVGNVYARAGYNFGYSITEKAGGDDYMKLKSDGYFILTPGYSLIAQKRIYPSAWFQIRPYASIGVEYDVLGTPDNVKYKFAVAKHFTKYDIEIDPLWANIGGGMEFLSATGVQVGLDYRYQYNADIQMHKIKLSGSYRF